MLIGQIQATRTRHALEFKLEAVRMVKGGQSQAAVSKVLDDGVRRKGTGVK